MRHLKNFRRSTSTIQPPPMFISCCHSDCKAPCAPRPGRNPCETSRKSVSYTGSSTIRTARWRILSSYVGIPERASLVRRASLGDMHSTHRRGYVRAGFGAVQQRPEVALQVHCVFVGGLSVHANGPVLTGPSMAGCIHLMSMGWARVVDAMSGLPGEFRDPLSFRVHVMGSVYPACLPPTVHKMASPSLPRVPGVVPLVQRYYGTLRLLAVLSPHFVSFARRYHRFVPRSSPSASDVGRGSTWSW